MYFPKVKDFERDERGDVIVHSLRGPERAEAREQLAREHLIAGAEVRSHCGAHLRTPQVLLLRNMRSC